MFHLCSVPLERKFDSFYGWLPAKTKFGDLIAKLVTTTHRLIIVDPNNAIVPSAYFQIAPVPFVWSIAQRVSHDLIIRASIEYVSSSLVLSCVIS